jgi:hypothetical protein
MKLFLHAEDYASEKCPAFAAFRGSDSARKCMIWGIYEEMLQTLNHASFPAPMHHSLLNQLPSEHMRSSLLLHGSDVYRRWKIKPTPPSSPKFPTPNTAGLPIGLET